MLRYIVVSPRKPVVADPLDPGGTGEYDKEGPVVTGPAEERFFDLSDRSFLCFFPFDTVATSKLLEELNEVGITGDPTPNADGAKVTTEPEKRVL